MRDATGSEAGYPRHGLMIAPRPRRSCTFLPVLGPLILLVLSASLPASAQSEDLFARAEASATAGRWLEAAASYARFAEGLRAHQEPWRLAAMTGRAWALEQAGYRDSAIPLIVRIHALFEEQPELASRLPGPAEEDLLLRKAALERLVGIPARPTLDRYRTRFPQGKGIAGVYRDLAREAGGMEEWREFLRACVRLGARDARIARWRLELAEGELALGDTRSAIRLWKTVIVRHTRSDEAIEAVDRLIIVTGSLPIGDPVFVADLEELVRVRRAEFAARGTLAAAEALLARTRAMMQGADPSLDIPQGADQSAASGPLAVSTPPPIASTPSSVPAGDPPASPARSVMTDAPVDPVSRPAPASSASSASPASPPSPATAVAATSPAPAAGTPRASGSGLPAPTTNAPVRVRSLLSAPLPVRGGLEDYLKPLTFRIRSAAEARGLRIVPDRWYYRYAAGARELADAVVGLDIARNEGGMTVTVSVIYPAANVTDVFTMPWKERPLDEDYSEAARDILALIVRE